MIYVFGSNLAGRHGRGAAKYAVTHYGAKYGQGVGLQGKSYAIPTKDHYIKSMPLEDIEPYIKEFFVFADENPHLKFALTPIGCGLAGNKKVDVMRIICKYYIPDNVFFTREWFKTYNEDKAF